MEKLVIDRKGAAEALGISLPMLDRYMNRKDDPLPSFRMGRHIKIPVDGLREWLHREANRTKETAAGA